MPCSAAIMPGHLVEAVPTGLRPHATADGLARPAFAIESLVPAPRGTATEPIATPYASGDAVRWIIAAPGMLLYALVPAAAAAIVKGDALVSAGDGTLKKVGATPVVGSIVALAEEALNNSGGGTPARIKVRAY
jgi:hypothetical protein